MCAWERETERNRKKAREFVWLDIDDKHKMWGKKSKEVMPRRMPSYIDG